MPQTPLSACIRGIGLLGAGLAGWPAAAGLLRGETPYHSERTVLPAPAALPAAERRRAGRLVRLALAAGAEAIAAASADARAVAGVFSSSGADGDNCHEICASLAAGEALISPTRFHNSVHNAAAGYWSIAHGCQQPYTALCAYDGSFGAGLLEALCQLEAGAQAMLLVSYDADYPPPLHDFRPISDAFAIALLLSRTDAAAPAAPAAPAAAAGPAGINTSLSVTFTDAAATRLSEPALESLRTEIPAARALPLLRQLAAGQDDPVVIDYLDELRLHIEVRS